MLDFEESHGRLPNEGDIPVLSKRRRAEDVALDVRACQGLSGCDVVIYVASLECVPDGSYEDEIELVTRINPRTIGVLNKREAARGTDRATAVAPVPSNFHVGPKSRLSARSPCHRK